MIDTKLLDSSLWIDFIINGKHKEIIEGNGLLYLSALSLFEIKKKLITKKYSIVDIEKGLNYIKEKSIIVQVDAKIAEKAVQISVENKIPMADSIIYTTALMKQTKVHTLDNDFKNLKSSIVLK